MIAFIHCNARKQGISMPIIITPLFRVSQREIMSMGVFSKGTAYRPMDCQTIKSFILSSGMGRKIAAILFEINEPVHWLRGAMQRNIVWSVMLQDIL